MVNIEKKIWPEFFELVLQGKKNVELRIADFGIDQGDVLVLREWDPNKNDYTGRELTKRAGNVVKFSGDDFFIMFPKEKIGQHGICMIELQ